MVLKLHRKLPSPPLEAEDYKWDVAMLDSTNEEDMLKHKDKLHVEFKDKSQLTEYAYGFWM